MYLQKKVNNILLVLRGKYAQRQQIKPYKYFKGKLRLQVRTITVTVSDSSILSLYNILVVINNGQIQQQQRVVFLQPVQQANGQVTYIQTPQQIQAKPQQVRFLLL